MMNDYDHQIAATTAQERIMGGGLARSTAITGHKSHLGSLLYRHIHQQKTGILVYEEINEFLCNHWKMSSSQL